MPPLAALVAGALAAAAAALALHRPDRLAGVLPERAPPAAGRAPAAPRTPLAACLLLSAAVLMALPLVAGVPLALAAVVLGPRWLDRLEPSDARRHRDRLRADLPLVLDLLAACLAGGAALPAAAAAVAAGVPGPAGQRLAAVAAALRVGTPPAQAWAVLAGDAPDDDPLGPAARALARAAEGGAPVAAAVARQAEDARRRARAEGEAAARRAGVLAVAPLGLCFLPAFVLLGVVPVVAGLAGPLLDGS